MNYHPGAQVTCRANIRRTRPPPWKPGISLSDRGQVRAGGDDVQLDGNVRVTGPAPGSDVPLVLTTESLRINTPTEFIETDAPVKLRWSGTN